MARRDNQKLKILYLLKILCEHSSKGQALTMPEIIKELSDKYGICAERKSIYSDLEGLRTFGINVVGEKNGRLFSYYINSCLSDNSKVESPTTDCKIGLEQMILTVGMN